MVNNQPGSRKPCRYPGCDDQKAPGKGMKYCQKHHDESSQPRPVMKRVKVCVHPECNMPLVNNLGKRCPEHSAVHGADRQTVKNNARPKNKCEKPDCDEVKAPGRGVKYCEHHRQEAARNRVEAGHTDVDSRQPRVCIEVDCNSPRFTGFRIMRCEEHQAEFIATRSEKKQIKRPCRFPGCENARITGISKWYCESHQLTYSYVHKLVRKTRGSASQYECELKHSENCKGKASHWSWVHDTDGSDPLTHFRPLCVPCHQKYDGIRDNIPQSTRDKLRAANTGKKLTEEHRLKIGESNRRRGTNVGRVQPDEEKNKRAESLKKYYDNHVSKNRGRVYIAQFMCDQCTAGPFKSAGYANHMRTMHGIRTTAKEAKITRKEENTRGNCKLE